PVRPPPSFVSTRTGRCEGTDTAIGEDGRAETPQEQVNDGQPLEPAPPDTCGYNRRRHRTSRLQYDTPRPKGGGAAACGTTNRGMSQRQRPAHPPRHRPRVRALRVDLVGLLRSEEHTSE